MRIGVSSVGYVDEADTAVLVLETDKKPPEEAIHQIAEKCRVSTKNLFLVVFSTASLAGSTQVSGRIVETGLHKLEKLGLDPLAVKHAWGYAPIIPLHPKSGEAMGRTNDAILYGGTANYIVSHDDDEMLEEIVKQAPSTSSKISGTCECPTRQNGVSKQEKLSSAASIDRGKRYSQIGSLGLP